MRGKSSSKQGKEREMEIETLKEQQPHLSGAYIRSLVKQLSHNTRNKDSSNTPKLDENVSIDDETTKQHKKQVRRRLHTTRPYQERLLNMAEARREIVTALKFHRASMKQQQQQKEQKQPQQGQQEVQPLHSSLSIQDKQKPRRNQKNYEPNNTNYFGSLSTSNFSYCPPPCNPYNSYHVQENFMNFALPNQALGLNLNIQDFNNLETTLYNSSNYPSVYSSSSSASSSSSPPTSYSAESFPRMAASSQEGGSTSSMVDIINEGEIGMHPRMDDKEIEEIISIGDQHQMELNDTLNLVSSAWWFKFLKSMEIYENDQKTEEYGSHPFDEIMEFPAWLNANESCLQQHLQDYYSDDYFKDPALPCMDMDIHEIEAMDDGEWLS